MLVRKSTGLLQKMYIVDVIKGLLITMRNFIFEKKVTIQFPEERRNYSDRFRGMHYIKAVNGVENCTACMLCPTSKRPLTGQTAHRT